MTPYQNFIHLSKYARFREDLGRRETWEETVYRYITFFKEHLSENYPKASEECIQTLDQIRSSILNFEVVPSMRALKSAGKALKSHNVAGYNCAFVAIDHPHVFDEMLYVSCCGTGIGFSVEQKHISKLPEIPFELYETGTIVTVPDSKIGWATSLREIISLLYAGKIPKYDTSKVRPYGSLLKTFGGRASGPQPLINLFEFVIAIFNRAAGRKLSSLECHDIACMVGLIAESGGTRRAALLSLSDLDDSEMRHAKSGNWYDTNIHRAYANNSAAYYTKPEFGKFVEESLALYRSHSGERGIFNVSGLKNITERADRRDWSKIQGVNPCGEILLRNAQFCNLSEVIVRPDDSLRSLEEKVRVATFLGTIQSTLTKFKYIRKIWQKNCEEERLLGVSMTGIFDNPIVWNDSKELLQKLKEVAISENKYWAKVLDINESTAITTGKPSGNTSQLCDTASGAHRRHSPFGIRTVRSDKKDPLTKFMVDHGFPNEDCINKPLTTTIFSFPFKSPPKSVFRNDHTAVQQLEYWRILKQNWAEHNISQTVYIKDNEWLDVWSWIYKNFETVGGLSFLPYDGGLYKQAPYQECTKEQYEEFLKKMPQDVDWSKLSNYEKEDFTTGSKELACASGQCEL